MPCLRTSRTWGSLGREPVYSLGKPWKGISREVWCPQLIGTLSAPCWLWSPQRAEMRQVRRLPRGCSEPLGRCRDVSRCPGGRKLQRAFPKLVEISDRSMFPGKGCLEVLSFSFLMCQNLGPSGDTGMKAGSSDSCG